MPERPHFAPVDQLFMLVLCVLALAGIVVQNAFRHDPEIEMVLDYADVGICAAFEIDGGRRGAAGTHPGHWRQHRHPAFRGGARGEHPHG